MDQNIGDQVSNLLYSASKKTWGVGEKGVHELYPVTSIKDQFFTPRFLKVNGDKLTHDVILGMNFDGIGSKVKVAEEMSNYTALGYDLVAMVCDDASAMGATPLMLGNVIDSNFGDIPLDIINDLTKGLVNASTKAQVPVINGEFAQVGNLLNTKLIWNAGVTWAIRGDKFISGSRVKPGDVIIGLRESGPRSNGFTLLRRIMIDHFGDSWFNVKHMEYSISLGSLALVPSTIYTPLIQRLIGGLEGDPLIEIHGMVHITGGGIPGKLGKYLKRYGRGATLSFLPSPSLIHEIALELKLVDVRDAYENWGMGCGFLIIIDEKEMDKMIELARESDISTIYMGQVTDKPVIHMKISSSLYW